MFSSTLRAALTIGLMTVVAATPVGENSAYGGQRRCWGKAFRSNRAGFTCCRYYEATLTDCSISLPPVEAVCARGVGQGVVIIEQPADPAKSVAPTPAPTEAARESTRSSSDGIGEDTGGARRSRSGHGQIGDDVGGARRSGPPPATGDGRQKH